MPEPSDKQSALGPYTGMLAAAFDKPALRSQLEGLAERLADPATQVLCQGRNRTARLTLAGDGKPLGLAVKSFAPASFPDGFLDRGRGGKACRTFLASEFLQAHEVGTPAPVAYLERREGSRLVESHFLSVYEPGMTNFRDELARLFQHGGTCSMFMQLLETVAGAVRRLHTAGFLHNDLGNQNILLQRCGEAAWGRVLFIDLNRARYGRDLSLRARARDISRIYLPSDFLRVFKEMIFQAPPAGEFQRWEQRYRRAYALHSCTRAIRHPVREARIRKAGLSGSPYPPEKDMWVWDDRSGQPVNVMVSRDRARRQAPRRHLLAAASTLRAIAPVWREYRRLLAGAYSEPVEMRNRVGVAVDPRPDDLARKLALLSELGPVPVMLRFYAHEDPQGTRFRIDAARQLAQAGHRVSVALIQDRASALNPQRWETFVARVLEGVSELAEWIEVGHAINRVKWGIWSFDEYKRLLERVQRVAERHPDVRLSGPAVIDFEYQFVMAAFAAAPQGFRFDALSHHLYVDRRGAPENRQGPFALLQKLALARAMARRAGACEDRLIVSEVNWPIKGAGVHSPVGSPYESPGPRHGDPSVSEDEYADYMLRYLVTTLCSGLAERVYWWRLVARGYGLVDDTQPGNWRRRPAFGMLRQFLHGPGQGTFVSGPYADNDARVFLFRGPDGNDVRLAYAPVDGTLWDAAPRGGDVLDAFGVPQGPCRGPLVLGSRPVYVAGGASATSD